MKKIVVWVFVILMATSFITGCTGSKNEPEADNGNKTNNDSETVGGIDEERISETGIYVGQIDNSSIEIKVNGKPMAFRLTDETRKVIEELDENDEVDLTYYRNEKNQNVLVSLIRKDMSEEDMKTGTGVYQGQLDNFSIEVEINGEFKAFVNYEMEQLLNGIEKDDRVEVKYSENKQDQLNLKSIKKLNRD